MRREAPFRYGAFGALLSAVLAAAVGAQDPPPEQPPAGAKPPQDLSKDKHNPFLDYIKLPLTFAAGLDAGPDDDFGVSLDIEPLLPVSLGADWDLIARPSLPVTYLSGPDEELGLGDLQASFFLTPAKDTTWVWGIGPIFQLPTATSKGLGSEKWAAGPTAALIFTEGPWFNGILVYHLWSFAGDPDRESVNQSYMEPLISYNFESGWFIQCDPAITYDWTADPADAWTVPLGLDIGTSLHVGKQAMCLQLGSYWFVEHPDGAPEWMVRLQVTFLFSS